MFESVVWLTGMPRSGTNWFGQIFASHPEVRYKLCPLYSYEFKNALNEKSTAAEWRDLLRRVYLTKSEYLDQEYVRREGLVPEFKDRSANPRALAIKSIRQHHLTEGLLEKCPEIKWIGIVRNPAAAVHSWLTNPLEFPAGADPLAEWRTGRCRKDGVGEFWGFDDWKKVAALFMDLARRYPDRFRYIRYELLVRSPEARILELFDWVGLDHAAQTIDFLRASQAKHMSHPRAVFKSPAVAERWRRELDPGIVATIEDELAGTPLERFLEPATATQE
jgi:hypothetical protein